MLTIYEVINIINFYENTNNKANIVEIYKDIFNNNLSNKKEAIKVLHDMCKMRQILDMIHDSFPNDLEYSFNIYLKLRNGIMEIYKKFIRDHHITKKLYRNQIEKEWKETIYAKILFGFNKIFMYSENLIEYITKLKDYRIKIAKQKSNVYLNKIVSKNYFIN